MKPILKEERWKKELEKPLYEAWKEKGLYKFNKASAKPVYSIDTPPPYVNTPIHIGQATTYVLMDMFARFRRMAGYNVLFPLGLDRNGLPIEMAAEKRFNVRLNDVPREKFLEMCKKVLEESSAASTDSFLRLGIGFNSWDVGAKIGDIYLTDSEDYRALTQETFIDMYNKKLIYEAERINNYCPGCRTTLADAEVEYVDIPTAFNDVVFKCKETGERLVIGTTRPELVCTCGMVIFHPSDKRYIHLEGKTAITPLFNREVPIKAHPMADPKKGTGIVMMCSAGDLSDIRFFREMSLEPIIAIDADGKMNPYAGFLEGLAVKEARERMVEELKKGGLLVKQEEIMHRTPICERSKHEIEFISMSELYVKQIIFKKEMKGLAKKMNFFAPKSRQILLNWIDSVNIDWPISRRRYYATEVPLWYCGECSHVIVPEKGRYYLPWKDPPPVKKCPKCNGATIIGDKRVFDTWFDSSITPLYILKYAVDGKFFGKNTPCSLRPQGKEIIRTWLYYTVLKDYLLTKKCIFRDVWINYHVLDEKGHKMSKSKGNVIGPKDVLDKFGAEPFRLWCAIEGNLDSTDFRCSLERIDGAGKTLTKLWNVAKFISMFKMERGKKELNELDKWILKETNELIKFSRERYEKYDFHNPAIRIKHFIWESFASHYLELVKKRAYNEKNEFTKEEQNGAVYTLNYCLEAVLKLLAPVTPFITCQIYKELKNKDIHFEGFPKYEAVSSGLKTEEIVALNSLIWKAKKDKNLGLRSEVKMAAIPKKFRGIEKDLAATHNIKKVEYRQSTEIEIS